MAGFSVSLPFTLGIVALSFAIALPDGVNSEEREDQQSAVRLVADVSAGPGRMMAVGISSLANVRADMADIDIDWVIRKSLIDKMQDDVSDMALFDLSEVDLAVLEKQTDLKTVMTFWPSDEWDINHPGYLLAARSTTSPDFVQAFLGAVRDDVTILKAARVDIDRLDPSFAAAESPLSMHEGANAFLASDAGKGRSISAKSDVVEASIPADDAVEPAQTPIPETSPIADSQKAGRSFTLYFETDDDKLDGSDFQSVADACRYAATLTNARFVISGHTDTVGSDSYNGQLAERRAAATAAAIKNDPRFREALSVIEHGEMKLAIATDDGVSEPKNRRVEITILEGDN